MELLPKCKMLSVKSHSYLLNSEYTVFQLYNVKQNRKCIAMAVISQNSKRPISHFMKITADT